VIPPQFYEAIVQIRSGGSLLGTGFLVSDEGLILTAKHVVKDRAQCDVCFPGGAVLAGTVEVGKRDWALVSVAQVPAGVQAIPLAPLEPISGAVRWSSAGYAGLYGGGCGSFHGDIGMHRGDEIDLYCHELANARYEDACGLSGGPCVVDGAVVGVVTDVLRRGSGEIIACLAMALPIELILGETARLAPSDGVAPPWEAVFTGRLQRLPPRDLCSAAELAGLARPVQSDRLAQQVARRMLHCGIRAVTRVLSNLIDPELAGVSGELLRLAESLWVESTAAARMKAASQDGRPSLLETERDWAARHHLHRARERAGPGHREWICIFVSCEHEESFVDAAMEDIVAKLMAALRSSAAGVAWELKNGDPVTAFVYSQPRADLIERVRAELPGLRLVFLSRASVSLPMGPVVDRIAPDLSLEVEDAADLDIQYAHRQLRGAGASR
jgi:hypothetical protein